MQVDTPCWLFLATTHLTADSPISVAEFGRTKGVCLLMMLDRDQRIASTIFMLVASFQPCHVFCPRSLLITVGLGPI